VSWLVHQSDDPKSNILCLKELSLITVFGYD
jgi:hypothetical protein